MKKAISLLMTALPLLICNAKTLHERQQDFVDLKFGMFTHFGIGTYLNEDWADPECSATLFNPRKLNCGQWADAARSAGMSFGCISVKHHNGFCMWDTETTDYSVSNSAIRRDVLKEYVDSMHSRGLKVMFHFSILDLHEKILPNRIRPEHTEFIKRQLKELLTNYGPVEAIMIDGWDAPWGRISYDEIPFKVIYRHIKSLQPECLVMDLNGAKYPADGLFYTDIKTYEQGAGQNIQNTEAYLPSMACDHLQRTWFWKGTFPNDTLPTAEQILDQNLRKKNQAGCTFILNIAPNPDGLLDNNAVEVLAEIGRQWHNDLKGIEIRETEIPITATNIAKGKHATGSWSDDCNIHDLANDDDFNSAWISNKTVENPWWTVELGNKHRFDEIALTGSTADDLDNYTIEYRIDGKWNPLICNQIKNGKKVHIHRFRPVEGDAVRLTFHRPGSVSIAEVGIYREN